MAGRKPFLAHWRDALRDSDLGSMAKLAGFVISTYCDSRGRCFPSKETVARGIGANSSRTADTAVTRLELSGFLSVVRSNGRRSNRYTLTIPTPQGVAGYDELNPATSSTQPRNHTHSTPQWAAPESGRESESESVMQQCADDNPF